jgi:hypothetical protein
MSKILSSRVSLVIVSLALLFAFGGLFQAGSKVEQRTQQLHKLTVNAERILNADAASTTAVRLAASLKADRYLHNYQEFQDTKYSLLDELTALPKTPVG